MLGMFVCILAWGIQHAKRMRRIILPSVDYLAVSYLPTLSLQMKLFAAKIIEHKMCFFYISLQIHLKNISF